MTANKMYSVLHKKRLEGTSLWLRGLVPRHALHQKGVQGQKSFVALVSSQKQRAPLVLLMNRGSIAPQPPVVFRNRFTWGFACLRFLKDVREDFVNAFEVRGTLVSWKNCSVGVLSCPSPPCRPAVRPAPTRLWNVRVLESTGELQHIVVSDGLSIQTLAQGINFLL